MNAAAIEIGEGQVAGGTQVDGDHRARPIELVHDVGGQVVHHPAVDEHMVVLGEHGRQDSRDRDARTHRAPERSGGVRADVSRSEVGRDAVVVDPQVLDMHALV